MVSKEFPEGLPLPGPASSGALHFLTRIQPLLLPPNTPGPLLLASILAFAQASPMAWNTLSAAYTQWGAFIFAVLLPSLPSLPLCPSLAQVGLE